MAARRWFLRLRKKNVFVFTLVYSLYKASFNCPSLSVAISQLKLFFYSILSIATYSSIPFNHHSHNTVVVVSGHYNQSSYLLAVRLS